MTLPPYERVKELKAQGASREQVLAALKADGVDDESAKVLLNAVMGPLPIDVPSAQISPGTNLLAPSVFTLSDIGLTGAPTVVGVYWMGFGVAILVALGLGALMTVNDLVPLPEGVGPSILELGGVTAVGCLAWGAFRYSQGVVIRRR